MEPTRATNEKTILICEDEPDLRELIRAAVEHPYRFVDAVDGPQALHLARELQPDLVVLDLMLPRLSGLAVLAEVRNDPAIRDTRVVVVSAWSHTADEAIAAGADRFLPKPFDPDELRAVVEELLARP